MSKKSKKREIFVKVCPRCGSTRVARTFGRRYISSYFFCQDCNFEGPLFPEISTRELKKLPKMSPSPKYLMWRRPTTAEVKPLERAMKKKNSPNLIVTSIYVFLIFLAVLIFVLAIV
jgi:predicted RNA-binding Zn-ribbon protein involved in translation (DUF1610 family)